MVFITVASVFSDMAFEQHLWSRPEKKAREEHSRKGRRDAAVGRRNSHTPSRLEDLNRQCEASFRANKPTTSLDLPR